MATAYLPIACEVQEIDYGAPRGRELFVQFRRNNATTTQKLLNFRYNNATRKWELITDEGDYTSAISGGGGSVDLSKYYTKIETDALIAAVTGTDLSAYVTLVALSNALTAYYEKAEVDQLLQDQYDELSEGISAAFNSISAHLSNYYDKPAVDALLAALPPAADLSNYYDKPAVDQLLQDQFNVLFQQISDSLDSVITLLDSYYTKVQTDALLAALPPAADLSNYYDRPEVDALLAAATGVDLSNYYDKDEIESLALKPLADLTSLLAADYYKRPEVDALLAALPPAADLSNYYDRPEIDALLAALPTSPLAVDLSAYAKKIQYENFFARGITCNEFFVYEVPATAYLGAEGLGWQIGIDSKPGPTKGRLGALQVEFSASSPTHYPDLAPGVANRYDIFALLSDIASQQDLIDGTSGRLVDTALLKGAITQLGQFFEDKFTTVDQGAGFAMPGWVYTLVTVNGQNGASETTYGWRELPGGGGAVDLSAYARLSDRGQRLEADALSGENVVLRPRGAVDATADLALQAAYSNQLDRIWVRGRTQWETRFLATHEDLLEALGVVQAWFGEAGLPLPVIPSRRIAGAVLDSRLGVEDEAAAQALVMARLSALAPELVGTAAEGQIEARIADKMAPPSADELAELIDAARPVRPAPAVLVTRQELDEALVGLGGGVRPEGAEVALRLEHNGTDSQPLPAQVWRTLQTDTQALVEGPWAVTGGALSVPELGEYLIDVRGFLAPVATPVDVLLRVVGPQGVYTADSLTATAVGSVLNLSGVIAAAADDVLQVQAYAEGSGVELLAGGLTISLRRQGTAPARRVLPAAQGTPWSEPAPEEAPAAARQATITLPGGTLNGTNRIQTAITVAGEGGMTLGLAAGSGIVKLGSQLGRLLEVSGRVDRATTAELALSSNAISNTAVLGKNPRLPAPLDGVDYAQCPGFITARATATRADFSQPTAGCWANPRTIYVSTSAAELRLNAAGTAGSGGAIVLKDITPGGGDYIGADIVFEGQPMRLPASTGDLLVPPGAEAGRRLSSCDIPALQGVGDAANIGHQYSLNPLPNGIYRFSGEYTVVGPHVHAGWKLGWSANNNYKDQWIPTHRRKNADGSTTYRFSWLYRMGSADGTVVGLYFHVDPGAGNGGKEMVITGKTTLRRTMVPEVIELEMPFAANQPIGTAFSNLGYDVWGQQWDYSAPGDETPLMMVSAGSLSGLDAPNIYNSNWASTWGATPVSDKISVAPLFGNIGVGSGAGQVRWKATLDVLTKDALAGATIMQRVVAGSSNPSAGTMVPLLDTSDPRGTFRNIVEFDVRQPDGGMLSNFLVASLRSAAANNVLLRGCLRLVGTVNPTPLP